MKGLKKIKIKISVRNDNSSRTGLLPVLTRFSTYTTSIKQLASCNKLW